MGDGSFENPSHFNPNVGIGAYLKKNLYFSLSVPQLLATKRYKDDQGISTSAQGREYLYALSGLRVPLKGDWRWVNSALFCYVSDAPISAVFNTGMGFK